MSAVLLDNVTLSYSRRPAIHHLSGAFETGSLTAITGPNGAGKSTLLKGIAGLIRPSAGRIGTGSAVAYLPQAAELQTDFPLSVLEMVSIGFWRRTGCTRAIQKNLRQEALQGLADVGLQEFADRPIGTLSCGQFQRAQFARLIAQDAPIILLDEPFAAVDATTTQKLLAIVQAWHKAGRTVICVLHDDAQIKKVFPECLLLARECIAWGKTEDVLQAKLATFQEAWQPDAEVCEL